MEENDPETRVDDDDDDDDDDADEDDEEEQSLVPRSREEIPAPRRRTVFSRRTEESQARTSVIVREDLEDLRLQEARQRLKDLYHRADFNNFDLDIQTQKDGVGRVMARGPRGGSYPVFTKDGSLNEKLSKGITKYLGPTREAILREKDELSQKLEEDIKQDQKVADDPNESTSIRERARERVEEQEKQLEKVETEQEQLEQGLSVREKIKRIFKKYGFTLAAVAAAVGATIGVIVSSLTSGLKMVAGDVGNGLKALGKKLGSILPGLPGTIAEFVFRAAGEAIKFLGENAWLLILAVAAFMIERRTKQGSKSLS